jgi:hypothetical protein
MGTRRLIALLLACIAAMSVIGSAAASSPRIRTDPNDSRFKPDIRSVITDLSPSTVLLRVDAWDRVRLHGFNTEYMFYMDTFGDPGFDRWVEVLPSVWQGKPAFVCVVEDNVTGALIGTSPASRPDGRSVACHLPRTWFGHIDRAVRFFVQVRTIGERRTDRAPNRGLYIWI